MTTRKSKTKARETDTEWWDRMARDYPHVDLEQQYRLASRWADSKGRSCSRPYLLNWLKKAEEDATPVAPPPSIRSVVQPNATVAELLKLAERGRQERAQQRRKAAVG